MAKTLDNQRCPKCGKPATSVERGERALMAGEDGWRQGEVVKVSTWVQYSCAAGHDWAPTRATGRRLRS